MNPLCLLGHDWEPIGAPYEGISGGATFGPYRCSVCGEERLRTRGIGLSDKASTILIFITICIAHGLVALLFYSLA